ncbi:hypothetical protein ACWEVY_28675 [Streptomyces longwoodensis]
MANEISYPFTADSAGGGSQMVSQAQWQPMAQVFGKDRVDYRLAATSGLTAADLPFAAQVVNGTSVSIAPGNAFVGGFYYKLTATKTLSIAPNTGSTGRIDLIVLRASLATSSVNLAVVQGQPAASPKAPSLTRSAGATWEMPLYQVTAPANSGALSLVGVAPFDTPDVIAAPWNTSNTAGFQPVGTFLLDMDNNNSDSQSEWFVGRDGTAVLRDLGKPRAYTPSLVNATFDLPAENKKGRWRWIAPGLVHFSVVLVNDYEDQGPVRKGASVMGITLPVPASGATGHVLKGALVNPGGQSGLPDLMDITVRTQHSGTAQTVGYLYFPSPTNLAQGLDSLSGIPPLANLTVSGVYEASTFGN